MRAKDDSSQHRRRRIGMALAAVTALAAAGWIKLAAPERGAPRAVAAAPALSTPPTGDSSATADSAASKSSMLHARIAQRPDPARAAQPLPPRGTPLAAEFDELKARADAGDAAAASRLYHDIHACNSARRMQRIITANVHNMPAHDATTLSAAELKSEEQQLKWMQEELGEIDRQRERCAGATDAQIEALVPSALRAAQLGDSKAFDCYAGMSFGMMPGLLDHPEWLAGIRLNTPSLFDSAIRQGDWVAVELLHHAYAGIFADTPGGQTFAPDIALDYRMLRLERLGARNASFVAKLDRELADATARMTAQQIAEGDAWAQDAYSNYFDASASDEVSNGANICQNSDD